MRKQNSKSTCFSLKSNSSNTPILEFTYSEPLFDVVSHPQQPIIISGLSNGYMFCHKYDPDILKSTIEENIKNNAALTPAEKSKSKVWQVVNVTSYETVVPGIELLWKTRRHKGSVRSICFNSDGTHVYSIGTDGILKKADTLTGKVINKCTLSEKSKIKYTKLVKSTSHPFLLLGDEEGNVTIIDEEKLTVKNVIKKIHNGDSINDIFQFIGKSIYKFISLGQTTLAYWDSRESNDEDPESTLDNAKHKRKIFLSDDQEDEILCGTFVDPKNGDNIVCGMGEGILTLWKPKKNNLTDQVTRIKICKGESIDCIISTLQDDMCVWCGSSDGNIYKVDIALGKICEVRRHSEFDEVSFLDLDYDYRVVSGGMDMVKIWDLNDKVTNKDDDLNSSTTETSSYSSDSEAQSEISDDTTQKYLSKEDLISELEKDISSTHKVNTASKRLHITGDSTLKRKKQKKSQLVIESLKESKKETGIRKFEGL